MTKLRLLPLLLCCVYSTSLAETATRLSASQGLGHSAQGTQERGTQEKWQPMRASGTLAPAQVAQALLPKDQPKDQPKAQSSAPQSPQPAAPATSVAAKPKLAAGDTDISAVRIYGTHGMDMVAEGAVRLRRDTLTLTADRLTYSEPADKVTAKGNVRIRQPGTAEISGPSASFVLGTRRGEFTSPKYTLSRKREAEQPGDPSRIVTGSGKADALKFEGENHYRALNATWTTCKASDPDWYIKAGEMELDYDHEMGRAKNGTVVFKNVPLFWTPWAEFPLAGQRQSGLLSPMVETSNRTGFGLTIPYYWNIAPNYDMTITPRFMSRRGLQLGTENRYLGESYNGVVRGEYLKDRVTDESRWLGSIQHRQWLTSKLYGSVDINGVSDDAYFEDLSTRVSMSSKANLVREGRLIYNGDGWWNASALMQTYQTLSPDPDHPITTPYRRLPQIALNALRAGEFNRIGTSGLDFTWNSEFVRFIHPDEDHPDASRLTAYPQMALPLQWSGFYLTPKFGVHYTRYDIDRPQGVTMTADDREKINRVVPVSTVDTGINLERQARVFGRDYRQTLEPRIYYVYAPYRRQDDIPIFDTSRLDFGFAQIFSENIYMGGDRVANANQLTAAITSRMIEQETGVERWRFLVGQRYYFEDQLVTLPEEAPRTNKRADIMAGLGGRIGRKMTFESLWQYNPRESQTERYSATFRYNPAHARALNLSYRYARSALQDKSDGLEDVDVSGQWPLWGKWYGVARLTQSIKDNKLTEAIAGLEYNGGCWVLRMGGHRYATRKDEYNKTFFLQLELTDLGGIGTNPVSLIKRSVPGYGKINEPGPLGN